MTLVGYSTWSVLCSPFDRVKPTDCRDDDVGNPLDCVGSVVIVLEKRLSSLDPVNMTRIEKRSRREKLRIANVEIPKIINPEFVLIPVKGWGSDFSVNLVKFMNVFPCS